MLISTKNLIIIWKFKHIIFLFVDEHRNTELHIVNEQYNKYVTSHASFTDLWKNGLAERQVNIGSCFAITITQYLNARILSDMRMLLLYNKVINFIDDKGMCSYIMISFTLFMKNYLIIQLQVCEKVLRTENSFLSLFLFTWISKCIFNLFQWIWW